MITFISNEKVKRKQQQNIGLGQNAQNKTNHTHIQLNPFRPITGFTTLPLHLMKPGSIKRLHGNPCAPIQNALCPETFSHMMHSKVRTLWWQTQTCYFFVFKKCTRSKRNKIYTKDQAIRHGILAPKTNAIADHGDDSGAVAGRNKKGG